MTHTRYQPISFVHELQREFFPFLYGGKEEPNVTQKRSLWTPKVDIKEEEKKFIVLMDIPGVESKDIDIEVEGEFLTIKGERKAEQEETQQNYYRMERYTGKFYRQLALPKSIDAAKIQAKIKNGVLVIDLPKQDEGKQQHKIQVEEQ